MATKKKSVQTLDVQPLAETSINIGRVVGYGCLPATVSGTSATLEGEATGYIGDYVVNMGTGDVYQITAVNDGTYTVGTTLGKLVESEKQSNIEHAETADVAEKLGTDTVGGTAQPIFLDAGAPKAISDTVGSTSQPVYVKSGVLTAATEVPTTSDITTAAEGALTDAKAYTDSAVSGIDLSDCVKTSDVGVTVASLVDGVVPSDQLPSYVDDVLEYDSYSDLPAEGEKDKIYVTTDDNKIYRWSGSTYIEINSDVSSADHAASADEATHAESADSATTAEKLGTSSVGSGINPIFLNSGVATASTSTVGSATKPAYLNAGTLTECGASLDVDISGNAATATTAESATTANTATNANYLTSDAGDGTNLIMIEGGLPTESKETVGSTSVPVYLSGGKLTQATAVPTASDISAALTTAQSYADSAASTAKTEAESYTDTAVANIDHDEAQRQFWMNNVAFSLNTSGELIVTIS